MEMRKMFDNLADKAEKAVSMDDTYIDEEGFGCCKKCNTRRQLLFEVPNLGISRKVSKNCDCQEEELKKQRAEEERQERLRRIELMRISGFPDAALMKCTFENEEGGQKKVIDAAKRYVEKFDEFKKDGKGLLLYGSVGTGKTYVAAAIANALIDKGIRAMVTNFARITNKLQESFDGRQDFIDGFNNFDLLVIDDLAAERKTEYMQEIMFHIIDARYRSGKPMIITTNLSLEALKHPAQESDARIFDRIMERCFPIEVKGDSIRKKKVIAEYADMKEKLGLN